MLYLKEGVKKDNIIEYVAFIFYLRAVIKELKRKYKEAGGIDLYFGGNDPLNRYTPAFVLRKGIEGGV